MSDVTLTFDTLQSRLRFRGELIARTGLRIGVGRDTDVAGHDLPVIRDASGRPFIPGASFKGVLRATLEALVRGLSDAPEIQRSRLACLALVPSQRCIPDRQKQSWADQYTGQPATLARRILENSCLICQTFGSTWLASHVAIRDLTVDPSLWFGQFELRQGVSLDRDTETAREGLLYNFETVPPGTRFALEIEADNLADWQKGLLLLGLQPFARGEISLGGARSRGLGQVALLGGEWHGWSLGESRVDSVMAFLADDLQLVSENDRDVWQRALRAKLEEVARA